MSLTGILDKQLESATEITLNMLRRRRRFQATGEAAGIKLPVRPKKPDPIQGTDVTKDSLLYQGKGTAVPVVSTEFQNLRMVSFSGSQGTRFK